jgi:hypothetical protein
MYGLPPEANLSFLGDQTLLQVCIGLHELILNFDQGVSITITSSVGFAFPEGTYHRYDDFREAAAVTSALLNQRVLSATGQADGTLSLKFEGCSRLDVFYDSKQYESYTIRTREHLIVV